MTVKELAQQAYDSLEWADRDDGTRYVRKTADHPEWLEALCLTAHGESFPDDYKYEYIYRALEFIADEDEDAEYDPEADAYNGQLCEWLKCAAESFCYVDEAVDEYGYPGSLFEALQMGQIRERQEVYDLVLQFLGGLAD
jgi:hypothetical protein